MLTPHFVVDAGHGDNDPGAIGPAGTKEKDIALQFSLELADDLSRTAEVTLTRTGDTYPTLHERAELANRLDATLISIHCNSYKERSAKGFEVWTSKGQTDSDILATDIYNQVKLADLGLTMRHDFADGDPDKEASFHVLRATSGPAVLIELGFISNPEGEQRLLDPVHMARLRAAIVRGIRANADLDTFEGYSAPAVGEADLHDPDKEDRPPAYLFPDYIRDLLLTQAEQLRAIADKQATH